MSPGAACKNPWLTTILPNSPVMIGQQAFACAATHGTPRLPNISRYANITLVLNVIPAKYGSHLDKAIPSQTPGLLNLIFCFY
jgi:hypothetical protein